MLAPPAPVQVWIAAGAADLEAISMTSIAHASRQIRTLARPTVDALLRSGNDLVKFSILLPNARIRSSVRWSYKPFDANGLLRLKKIGATCRWPAGSFVVTQRHGLQPTGCGHRHKNRGGNAYA